MGGFFLYLDETVGVNKRKRVALLKHRAKRKKLKARQRAAR